MSVSCMKDLNKLSRLHIKVHRQTTEFGLAAGGGEFLGDWGTWAGYGWGEFRLAAAFPEIGDGVSTIDGKKSG